MNRLNNAHKGRSAVVIFGGPSILENNYDLSFLNKINGVVFLESKALTAEFLQFNVKPDYYLMPYPEKTRTNTLQHQFMQSISCHFDLGPCLRDKYADEWYEFRNNFHKYAEVNRVEYPHKRYRIKKGVVLNNSPLSILQNMPDTPLITYDQGYDADQFEALGLANCVHKYTHSQEVAADLKRYLNPELSGNKLVIEDMGYVNSSAISLYPLLTFMGFEKVFFIGMDMSLLGSFEYSAVNTFKSMSHYRSFFNAARSTFSYDFPRGFNRGLLSLGSSISKDFLKLDFNHLFSSENFKNFYHDSYGLAGNFMREKNQLKDCEDIFTLSSIEYVNIYEKYKYALPIPGISNISYEEFMFSQLR